MFPWPAPLYLDYWILWIWLGTVQNSETQAGVYGWLWFGQCSVVSFVTKKFLCTYFLWNCIYLVIQMYFIKIYFYLLWSGINLQILWYFRIFVEPTRNVNYKGKQNCEKIQRVKIRLALSNYIIKPCKWDQKLTY